MVQPRLETADPVAIAFAISCKHEGHDDVLGKAEPWVWAAGGGLFDLCGESVDGVDGSKAEGEAVSVEHVFRDRREGFADGEDSEVAMLCVAASLGARIGRTRIFDDARAEDIHEYGL